jgi:hypothetical protein
MKTTIEELAPYMREVLIYLTRWVRLRLRAALWRQWKTPRRRRVALLELGVREPLASNTAGSGRGPWYLAKAKALSVTAAPMPIKRRYRRMTCQSPPAGPRDTQANLSVAATRALAAPTTDPLDWPARLPLA